jgi:hypothetical protein
VAKLSQQAIITQIDSVLTHALNTISKSQYRDGDCSDLKDDVVSEANGLLHSIIDRLSPVGSKYRENANNLVKEYKINNSYILKSLVGLLKSLKAEYVSGGLQSIQELIHADVFADFLEMADHLLSEGYKDPAAVIAGSVLEEHLRKLSNLVGITILKADGSPKKADALNAELAGNSTINKLDQKSVTAWLDLRNKAAHGHYTQYTKEQVAIMVSGVREFISRNPA